MSVINRAEAQPVRPDLARHVCSPFCDWNRQLHAELEFMSMAGLRENIEWVQRSGPGIFPLYYQPPGETHVYRVVQIQEIQGLPPPDLDRLANRLRSKGIPEQVVQIWLADPRNREVSAMYVFHTKYAYVPKEHVVARGRGLPEIELKPEIAEEEP